MGSSHQVEEETNMAARSQTGGQQEMFGETTLTTGPGVDLVDLIWNPGAPGVFAVCFSSGMMAVWQMTSTQFNRVASLPVATRATAISWSPKGKQIVVGHKNGKLTQFSPTLEPKKETGCPEIFASDPHRVTHIFWISAPIFITVYTSEADGDFPKFVVIHNQTKTEPKKVLNFEDVYFGTSEDRELCFFTKYIPEWNFAMSVSCNAFEIAVFGNKNGWEKWSLDDRSRAEMPLTDDNDETYPMGMAIDFTSTVAIPECEIVLPPAPILMLLSTDGVLCPFYLVNKNPQARHDIIKPPEALPPAEQRPKITATGGSAAQLQPGNLAPQQQTTVKTTTSLASAKPGLAFQQLTPSKPPGHGTLFPSLPTFAGAGPQGLFSLGAQSTGPPSFPTSVPTGTLGALGFSKPSPSISAPGTTPVATAPQKASTAAPPANIGSFSFAPSLPSTVGTSSALPAAIGTTSAPSPFAFSEFSSTSAPMLSRFLASQPAPPQTVPQILSDVAQTKASEKPVSQATAPPPFSLTTQPPLMQLTPQIVSTPAAMASLVKPTPTTQAQALGQGTLVNKPLFTTTVPSQPVPQKPAPQKPAPQKPAPMGLLSLECAEPKLRTLVPTSHEVKQMVILDTATGFTQPRQQLLHDTQQMPRLREQPRLPPPLGTRTPAASSKENLEMTVTRTILEEINHFNKELAQLGQNLEELKGVCKEAIQLEHLGDIIRLTGGVEKLHHDLKHTTKEHNKEIQDAKGSLLEAFVTIEDASVRKDRANDPRYLHLLKSRSLDPVNANKMRTIRNLYLHLDKTLKEVNIAFDEEWDKENVKSNKLQCPAMDSIYRTLKRHHVVAQEQASKLERISEQMKAKRMVSSWQRPPLSMSSSREKDLSSLSNTVLSQDLESPVKSPTKLPGRIPRKKTAELRDMLRRRQRIPVRKSVAVPSSVPRPRKTLVVDQGFKSPDQPTDTEPVAETPAIRVASSEQPLFSSTPAFSKLPSSQVTGPSGDKFGKVPQTFSLRQPDATPRPEGRSSPNILFPLPASKSTSAVKESVHVPKLLASSTQPEEESIGSSKPPGLRMPKKEARGLVDEIGNVNKTGRSTTSELVTGIPKLLASSTQPGPTQLNQVTSLPGTDSTFALSKAVPESVVPQTAFKVPPSTETKYQTSSKIVPGHIPPTKAAAMAAITRANDSQPPAKPSNLDPAASIEPVTMVIHKAATTSESYRDGESEANAAKAIANEAVKAAQVEAQKPINNPPPRSSTEFTFKTSDTPKPGPPVVTFKPATVQEKVPAPNVTVKPVPLQASSINRPLFAPVSTKPSAPQGKEPSKENDLPFNTPSSGMPFAPNSVSSAPSSDLKPGFSFNFGAMSSTTAPFSFSSGTKTSISTSIGATSGPTSTTSPFNFSKVTSAATASLDSMKTSTVTQGSSPSVATGFNLNSQVDPEDADGKADIKPSAGVSRRLFSGIKQEEPQSSVKEEGEEQEVPSSSSQGLAASVGLVPSSVSTKPVLVSSMTSNPSTGFFSLANMSTGGSPFGKPSTVTDTSSVLPNPSAAPPAETTSSGIGFTIAKPATAGGFSFRIGTSEDSREAEPVTDGASQGPSTTSNTVSAPVVTTFSPFDSSTAYTSTISTIPATSVGVSVFGDSAQSVSSTTPSVSGTCLFDVRSGTSVGSAAAPTTTVTTTDTSKNLFGSIPGLVGATTVTSTPGGVCDTTAAPIAATMAPATTPSSSSITGSTMTSLFGQPLTTVGASFVTPTVTTTSRVFGTASSTTSSPFPSASTSDGLFGTSKATIPTTAAVPPFSVTSSFGGGGSSNQGGLFDNTTTTSSTSSGDLFGTPSTSQSAGGSLFGTPVTASQPTGGGLFGTTTALPHPTSGSLFGATFTTSQSSGSSPFGTPVSTPSSTTSQLGFGQTGFVPATSSSAATGFGQSAFSKPQESSSGLAFGFSSFGLGGQASEQSNTNPFGLSRASSGTSMFGSGAETFKSTSPQPAFGGASTFGSQSSGGFGSGSFSKGSGNVVSSGFAVTCSAGATQLQGSSFGGAPAFGGGASFGGTQSFGSAGAFSGQSVFGGSPQGGLGTTGGVFGSSSGGGFGQATGNLTFGSMASEITMPSFGDVPQQPAFEGFGGQPTQSSGFDSFADTGGGGAAFGSAPNPSVSFNQWR